MCFFVQTRLIADSGEDTIPRVLLDKLLSSLDIHVDPFSLCEVSPHLRLSLPAADRVMLHFVLSGSGILRSAAGAEQRLQRCTLAVVPKGVQHSLESTKEITQVCIVDPEAEIMPIAPVISSGSKHPPEMIAACGLVKVRFGTAVGLFDELKDVLIEDLSEIPQVRSAFKDILAEQCDPGPGSEAMKAALMSQCLVYLFRRICETGTCSLPWLAALEDERLARALDRVLLNPGAPHTVESLAEVASMSRSAFAEAFTHSFGLPPMGMVRRIRLERAWKLLEQQAGLPIRTVARRVGFSSRSHFSRLFKSHFGVSPGARQAMLS